MRAVTLTGSEGAGRSVAEAAGAGHQEVRPRARGERSVRGVAIGRSRARRCGRRAGAGAEQRPELHLRQAFHRAQRRLRRLRGGVRRQAMPSLVVGDPMDPATEVGPAGARRRVATTWPRWSKTPVTRARRCCAAGSACEGPGTSTRPPCWPGSRPTMAVCTRGGLRPRGPALPGRRRRRGAADGQRLALRPRGERVDRARPTSASGSSMASSRAWSSSTPWWRPRRSCPSAG